MIQETASTLALDATGKGPNAAPRHYDYIDALRGVALLLVFAFHVGFAVNGLPKLLGDILGRGYAGVQLFFVVSSFTLCISLATRRSGTSSDRIVLRNYFLRRAFRILPMFWFAVILYMTTYGFWGRWSAPDGIEVGQIVLATLLLHGFDPHAINGVVPGGWSVATEVQFYLALPLLLFLASSLRCAVAVWLAALAIAIAAQPLIEHALAPFYPLAQRDIVHQFAFYTLPAQLPVFASGLVLFRLMGPDRPILEKIERWLPSKPSARALLIVSFMLIVGLPLNFGGATLSLVRTFPGHIGYGILAALLVYVFATRASDTTTQRGLRFVGRISYSGYLLHFFVLDTFELNKPDFIADRPMLHLFVLAGVLLVCTLPAAWLTYVVIEKPGIALGRRLIARLTAPRPTTVIEPPSDALLGQGAG